MSIEEPLLPNYGKLDTALRSVGYSFEVAVADIIDNSVDARASSVFVRLLLRHDKHLDLAIWDDGTGMSESTLKEAMRFGADVTQELERLGKFGLGLKLASLSQARELTVVAAHEGGLCGRAWLEKGIAKGFTSTILNPIECRNQITELFPERPTKKFGTVVRWSQLYRVGSHHAHPEEHMQKLLRRLEHYLSLAFHRFLDGRPRKLAIALDMFDQAVGRAGIPILLDPRDPFGYDQTGLEGFPAKMSLPGAHKSRVSMCAHIWPPNSNSPNYRLPGGANSRQGFYFYRNDRLIQGGGWNGIRESEPHSSLARVEVDIAADYDVELSLDVKKVEIQLPPEFVASLQKAETTSGVDFKEYLALADDTYRTRRLVSAELPLIPSQGLPGSLSEFLHKELRLRSTAKHRDLKFLWKPLDKNTFFDIDRDSGNLYLNSEFRRPLLHGLPGSMADIPVVKCLLFLVLSEALASERMGPKIREKVERVNRILAEAVKYERWSR